LHGVTQTATLNGNGDFSTTFNTAALGVAGSPYTITYSYAGDASFSPAGDSSTTLTVIQATPAGVTITPTSGLTTTESGGTATLSVVLTNQPAADVTVTF